MRNVKVLVHPKRIKTIVAEKPNSLKLTRVPKIEN
ncbi:hypothetical protein Goari_003880 [Gossypium aridum]|uniref:Uncharacterized protein n=1 Tax=Gossypium aridum TaxID=34290 RepID=A0A7J8Y3D8_GOSAI|nr:hypothetical protein [Gossypium aridum]